MRETAAPEVLEIQNDGSLLCLAEDPSEELHAEVEAAVVPCPVEAL